MRRRDFRRRGMTAALTCAVVLVTVGAILNPGVETTELDLNDGGVWVTNSQMRMVGHLNYPAHSLDSGLRAASSSFNVFQDGEAVSVLDAEGSTLTPVDVAATTLGMPTELPGLAATVAAGTVVIADGVGGNIWVVEEGSLSSFIPEEVEPDVSGIPGALSAVGPDGSVHVVSAQAGTLTNIVPKGRARTLSTQSLEGVTPEATLQVAAVGTKGVVLDRNTSTLYLPGGATQVLEGTDLVLQDSGPNSDRVLLASGDELLQVPIGGGEVVAVSSGAPAGNASRPVMHTGCAYAAWSVSGAFVRDCPDDADDVEMDVASLRTAEQALFRTNRDVIVLNDTVTGGLWLPDENMVQVDNWDQIASQLESEEDEEDDSVDETQETLLPDRTEENTPPVAVDDEFGVRAGRTVLLPVLQNDSDVDADFMTAVATSQPSLGTVSPARDGAALQIVVPEDATGSSSFEYEVSDGRGGTDTAQVSVTVHDSDVNNAPVQTIVPSVSLGSGRSMSTNALSSWYDPDGDPFYLEGAVAPAGISARAHEYGTLDLAEVGHGPGKEVVALRVSDGRDVGEGEISLTITDSGNTPPVANTDHMVVRVGSSATISPLANDTDPEGDDLRLVQIDTAPAGISAVMDGSAGTVTVEADTVGTYYLGYVITDGPSTSPGVIRVDVVDSETEGAPNAEDDLGVLAEGGYALIDLLANDSDPTGGVLTVQQVSVPSGSPLIVALIGHQMVRVTAPQGLESPATFTYSVSNGFEEATAAVMVIPAPAVSLSDPPELTDDTLVVREGDVASVDVLANDRSPAGLGMAVSDKLQHEITADLGSVFISDGTVRVRGGTRGGSGKIIYTVQDTAGNVSSAVVHLTVVAMDADTNTAPTPYDVTARTIAGRSVDITVPLEGIDREGDSVTLIGLGSAPQLGSAEVLGNVITYTAADTSRGTDSFTYVVSDHLGKQATGRIQVGIAPQATTNQDPAAVPDQVQVRPGTRVSVAVLANDIDPDGDALSLVPDSVVSQTAGVTATERSGRVVLDAPDQPGNAVVSYGVTDGVGGNAEGILTVVVSPDAPLLAPIARDDQVTQTEVQAATTGAVSIDVLRNDEDPDGDIADVTITSEDANVTPKADGTVDLTLTAESQILIYTVTDRDELSASAVIRVPGTQVSGPQLDSTTVPITVKAGATTDIAINDHIVTRDGRTVRITNEKNVTAGVGFAGGNLVKNPTTLTYTSLPEFSGPTSIALEVTDGADLNDSEGKVALISLPLVVEPGENRPPTFTPNEVRVAAGEEESKVDLAPMVTDPDKDDPKQMKYRIEGDMPTGISASLTGSVLSMKARADQAKGPAGTVGISVDDGKGGTTTGEVPITVVSSSRPLIQTSEAQVTLDAGKSATVDISQYATNPFGSEGGLSIVGTPVVANGGTATASGTSISVSANAGFSGSFTVTYRVVDVTKDVEREVQGIIAATVRDRPGAPANASVVSNGPGTAQVSWASGPANGAPITSFTVTDHTQGDSMECGQVTTCLFSGRKNGVDHTFSVTATNEVGTSDPSNQTTTMIDIEPETPGAPTLTAGDGQVTVSWVAPHNEGSAIVDYTVNLSPGGPTVVSAGTTSTTITGLTNGAEYTATVAARNGKGISGSSQASVPMVPFGAPGPVGSVQAQYSSIGTGTGQVATIDVSWSPVGNTNGRAIEYYTVSAGGISKKVQASSGTSTSLEGIGFSTSQVQFSVTATNDATNAAARTSAPTAASAWVVGQPLAPTIGSVSATGQDNTASLSWSASPAGQGWSPGDLSYQWSVDGTNWATLSGNTISGNGLSNGASQTVKIRAVGSKTGSTANSTAATSTAVVPYGPPVAPSISCVGGDQRVSCSWSGGNGNGRDATFALSGATSGGVGASGNVDIGAGYSDTKQVCVTVTQAESGRTAQNCASGTSNARVYLNQWAFDFDETEVTCREKSGCVTGHRLRLRLVDWQPGRSVNCVGNWNNVDATTTVQVDGNGGYFGMPYWNRPRYAALQLVAPMGTPVPSFRCIP